VRRNLVLGVIGVILFFGLGGVSLWWLVGTVRDKADSALHPQVPVSAVLVAADDRHLTAATTSHVCAQVSLHASESSDRIELSIDATVDPTLICTIAARSSFLTVTLSSPVGDRRIVDAYGSVVPRLDEDRLLTPRALPPGFGQEQKSLLPVNGGIEVTRVYVHGNDSINVTEGIGASYAPSGTPVPIDVAGHPAREYRYSGATRIMWSDGAVRYDVSAMISSDSAAVIERVARSMYP
jgi:hypothetical protein